ncbi:ATP-dependent DNA helicase [Azospira restricta]|uniref:DNA 5'-3' helicase n=1 Tax=Azospira restricta TaxID=404405 RepID=A0A974SNI4_9RHOO|nr:ATP-dependent DNA helicase [Azospira restricta]QRJ62963.1 ATP-dependent DNA helicase [Azospira restricta]
MSPSLSEVFSLAGPLAQSIPGYRTRTQQLEMAERVAAALADNRVLVAEAGTGTGKTYAYLVPALLSGGKVIVSTGTKTLQDQLFNRDLPTVRDALKAPVKIALLKGRANYVCHYHLDRALSDGRFLAKEDAGHARAIARFAKTTQSGDKGECNDVPESSPVWSMVTSTRENCLGQDCPSHKDCFVLAARRQALEADVVVVNHHLFFADVILKDEGMAELLPACNAVIFDEAHQLPETASLFFGDSVSTAQVTDLARDTKIEALASARDCLDLPPACATLEKAAKDLRLTLGVEPARYTLAQLEARAGFDNYLVGLVNTLEHFAAILETQAERSEGLESCWQRSLELLAGFRRWRAGDDAKKAGGANDGAAELENDGPGSVRWGEATTYSLQLNATPLAIGEIFRKQMSGHPRAWIFTSATLAVQKDFGHYCAEMGLVDAESACWESPFDYGSQAVLYAPQGLPEPNSPGFIEAVAKAAFPVVQASGGRAFFLCTSLRAMRRMHELLQDFLEREGLDYPLLLQGEGSKNELLERFRRLGNAILVGSQSFWEGVDVRGEALSLVVIDKLPFAPPDDPVLSARIERMNREGRNAFMEYQLPRAVINVKQGAGRLIRDESDRGVLMICDPRLITKPYGKRVWRSLPPMKRTRELAEVVDFFAAGALA